MAALATMMPNFGQKVSAKSDLVPEWTSQEVSTGVSTRAVGAGWTEPDPVLFLWSVFKYKQRLNETALLQQLTAANASKLVLIVKEEGQTGRNRTGPRRRSWFITVAEAGQAAGRVRTYHL